MAAGDVTIGGALGTKTVQISADQTVLTYRFAPDITISGRWSLKTLATGDNYGAAGAGTTSTSVVKPAASANWTANDMHGAFVRITSGTASGAVRPVIDNAATTITIHSATGLAAGDNFEVVLPTFTITTLTLERIQHEVIVENLTIGKLFSEKNAKVKIRNCRFATASASGSLQSVDDVEIRATECMFDGASAVISRAHRVQVTNDVLHDGSTNIVACNDVLVGIYGDACSTTALHLEQCLNSSVGIEAQGCTATPCHMESCNYVEPNGVGFIGTNAGAAYGILMEKAGYYDLTSGTLAGAADLRIEGTTYTWANLGIYKSVVKKGVTAMTTA